MKKLFHIKLLFIYTLLFLVIFSCSKQKEETIIPREEFIKLIADLHYTDAIISNRVVSGPNMKDSAEGYYDYVFQKYHTTKNTFEKSLAYYSENMTDFISIYDEVIESINTKMPKKLSDRSIYKIFEISYEDALMICNPDQWFGPYGKVILTRNQPSEINEKDTSKSQSYTNRLKCQSLLLLESEVLIYPEDSSKNLRMEMIIKYKDKSIDKVEKQITGKPGVWNSYHLFIRTNKLKKTDSIECKIINYDKLAGSKHGSFKNVFLKQYSPSKDTTGLVIIQNSPEKKEFKSNLKKINKLLRQG